MSRDRRRKTHRLKSAAAGAIKFKIATLTTARLTILGLGVILPYLAGALRALPPLRGYRMRSAFPSDGLRPSIGRIQEQQVPWCLLNALSALSSHTELGRRQPSALSNARLQDRRWPTAAFSASGLRFVAHRMPLVGRERSLRSFPTPRGPSVHAAPMLASRPHPRPSSGTAPATRRRASARKPITTRFVVRKARTCAGGPYEDLVHRE